MNFVICLLVGFFFGYIARGTLAVLLERKKKTEKPTPPTEIFSLSEITLFIYDDSMKLDPGLSRYQVHSKMIRIFRWLTNIKRGLKIDWSDLSGDTWTIKLEYHGKHAIVVITLPPE